MCFYCHYILYVYVLNLLFIVRMCVCRKPSKHYYHCAVAGRWLDKLGVAAKMGVDVVIRQSFFHGHYALLDDYMHPRPVCPVCMCIMCMHISVSVVCPCILLDISSEF